MTILLGLIAAAAAQAAAPSGYSKAYDACMNSGDAARGVTSGMMDCTGAEIDRQDARLNQAYKMVMARLSTKRKTELRASERQWILRRDATCKRQAKRYEGGTLAGLEYSSCILSQTVARRTWLERYR